jgi:Zn-dependent protease
MKHFDPIGLICFLIAGFGWAKPVPVNPYNFRNFKKGSFWVAVAGILTNYALAFIFYPLMYLTYALLPLNNYFTYFIYLVFYMGFALDLSFCVFNLIPVFPLDGFRIIDTFVNKRNRVYQILRRYGYYVLLGLIILSSMASRIPQLESLDIFGKFMTFAVEKFGYPIKAFWNFIFSLIFG